MRGSCLVITRARDEIGVRHVDVLDHLVVVHAAADEVRAARPGDRKRVAGMLDAGAEDLERDPWLGARGHVGEHLLPRGVHEPVVARAESRRVLALVLVQVRGGVVHLVDGLHPEVGDTVVFHAELDRLEAVAADAHRHAELPGFVKVLAEKLPVLLDDGVGVGMAAVAVDHARAVLDAGDGALDHAAGIAAVGDELDLPALLAPIAVDHAHQGRVGEDRVHAACLRDAEVAEHALVGEVRLHEPAVESHVARVRPAADHVAAEDEARKLHVPDLRVRRHRMGEPLEVALRDERGDFRTRLADDRFRPHVPRVRGRAAECHERCASQDQFPTIDLLHASPRLSLRSFSTPARTEACRSPPRCGRHTGNGSRPCDRNAAG